MIHTDSVFIYPQPNDIFDVLYSSKQKFSDWELRKFTLERGIVASEDIDREKLCLRIASLPFDHQMLEALNELLKTESRRAKTTNERREGEIKPSDIQATLAELKKRHPRENIDLNVTRQGTATIKVSYNKVDHGVTRLKQRKPKKAEIVIEKRADGNTNVRFPSSIDRIENIMSSLFAILDENSDTPQKRMDLNLSLLTPEQTNRFFLKLIDSIDELPLSHTIKVGVQKSPSGDDDQDLDEDEEESLSASITAQINKASVQGYNPTLSGEVQTLLQDGEYYIHTICWETSMVTVMDTSGREVEGQVKLEVKGYPTKPMQRLAYEVINFRRYSAELLRLLAKTEPLSPLQSKIYITMLEDAAYQCFEEVRNDQCATNGSIQAGD